MEAVERSYLCSEEEDARYNMGEVGCGDMQWIGEVIVVMMVVTFKGKFSNDQFAQFEPPIIAPIR